MEDYSRQRHVEAGYEFVYSPAHHQGRAVRDLGPPATGSPRACTPPWSSTEGQQYYLKPMNCPFHILVFRSRQRSYRELPMRLFEFGTVYRYEKSGVVHGLTRVRGMTQDDAHIFCTREQMADELDALLDLRARPACATSGSRTSTSSCRPSPRARRSARDEEWDEATEALRAAAAGDGPRARDGRGRRRLLRPEDLGPGARRHRADTGRCRRSSSTSSSRSASGSSTWAPTTRGTGPIMIHRALFGSVERFFAILLEHYAGALPTWLVPDQVGVLPVRDDHDAYARDVAAACGPPGLRVEVDPADEPLGARIRRGKLEKVPYVLVVGDDDVAAGTVGVNRRGSDASRPGRARRRPSSTAVAEPRSRAKGSPEARRAESA